MVLSIAISTNKRKLVEGTYKTEWDRCQQVQPLVQKVFDTGVCNCDNSSYDDSEDDVTTDNGIELMSISKFLTEYEKLITYNGSYYSQPGPYYPVAGAQSRWNMVFNYNESIIDKTVDIRVMLGPLPRKVFIKHI